MCFVCDLASERYAILFFFPHVIIQITVTFPFLPWWMAEPQRRAQRAGPAGNPWAPCSTWAISASSKSGDRGKWQTQGLGTSWMNVVVRMKPLFRLMKVPGPGFRFYTPRDGSHWVREVQVTCIHGMKPSQDVQSRINYRGGFLQSLLQRSW